MSGSAIEWGRRGVGCGTRRPSLARIVAPIVAWLLSGCVSNAALIEENSAVALRSARFQARTDLQCPQVEETVESEQIIPGAPWGYFYSDYRIRADGCGRTALYGVKCRDERLCRVTRLPR